MNELAKYSDNTFDGIKHINEQGFEYWLARELQGALEYTEWRNFAKIIEKAKVACSNSGEDIDKRILRLGPKSERRWKIWVVLCLRICLHPKRALNKLNARHSKSSKKVITRLTVCHSNKLTI